ncbi:hypothetical protein H9L13_07770 [Sphingomonas lutea]|uniref:Helix-turn-helix domain-containing protein n=1 Tax=Sphingomonas lutea TaxID=1045317 RepID=A0A7G9SFI4_9SPHN|nr:hypothetical protein [Sphingomonas lutea]QNN66609.1 hypothetical protein H9L13_07770 [Sphingomonas lutea]
MGRKRRKNHVDATGRSTRPDRFVKLDFNLLETPAYRSLSPGARAMLVEFNRLYNGANNGKLFLSQRDAADRVGVTSHTTAAGYIEELADRGFLRIKAKGSFSVKTRRATTYVLTQHSHNDEPASRDFKHWAPKEDKRRVQKSAMTGAITEPSHLLMDWDEAEIVAR